jgi:hypothetical protein
MQIKFNWGNIKGVFFLGLLAFGVWLFFQKASHDRAWEVGQEKLAHFVFDGDNFEIRNYRNFDWEKNTEGKASLVMDSCSVENELSKKGICYEARKYKLSDIETVNVIISHFDDFEGLAHIFISFVMKEGENIVMSMETRRELGEEFSPWLGMMRQFEIIYVVGSESDIIGLRTRVRGERVYVYPTIANEDKAQKLFLSLAKEVNAIYENPKMYHTLTSNCTNEITRRVEEISTLDFPLTWKTVLPGYFDEILHEMKVIPADKSFEEIKAQYKVDNTTAEY